MAAGGNVLWQIIWFLILIFIAFPVAGFCAGWYILILPFTVCIDGLTVSINNICQNMLSSKKKILTFAKLCMRTKLEGFEIAKFK